MSNMNGTLEIHGDKRCVTCVCDLHYGMQYMRRNAVHEEECINPERGQYYMCTCVCVYVATYLRHGADVAVFLTH